MALPRNNRSVPHCSKPHPLVGDLGFLAIAIFGGILLVLVCSAMDDDIWRVGSNVEAGVLVMVLYVVFMLLFRGLVERSHRWIRTVTDILASVPAARFVGARARVIGRVIAGVFHRLSRRATRKSAGLPIAFLVAVLLFFAFNLVWLPMSGWTGQNLIALSWLINLVIAVFFAVVFGELVSRDS